jgi:MGT family glycosyltransferase
MRVLFTTIADLGHFHPLVPIARAVAAAKHEGAFACPASFVATVEAAGFRAFPCGFDPRGRTNLTLFPGLSKHPAEERTHFVVANVFAGVFGVAMVPDLLTLAESWRPDVIVRETGEFGGYIAAEVLGLPHASVRADATSATYSLRHRSREAFVRLRELNGLDDDPDIEGPFRYLHLACEPARFVPPGEAHGPTAHLLRPVNFESGGETLPAWVASLPARPTIYATLGNLAGNTPVGRATFSAILEALRDEPINLIVTVGRGNDPVQFGPQPENVHIERYIPQGPLLPYCDLVINHGGFSTVTGALNAGLPMVVIPHSADQPYNAACCSALGVGRVVGPNDRTPEAIREAVRAVLADPTYRANAVRVRDETAALPGPEVAVELLERLARDKAPIVASR